MRALAAAGHGKPQKQTFKPVWRAVKVSIVARQPRMAAYQPGQIAGVAYSSDRHQQWHQFLTAYGLDLDSQMHVIETCPELLDTDIYSAGMVILLFKTFGYTDNDICSRILTMYPFLLAKSITRDLQPVLEHLEGAGCKGNDLRLLMWEYPRIFSNDFRRQARRFARLGMYGLCLSKL